VALQSPDIPSYRERVILKAVRYKIKMPPDEITIAKLLKKGWLEELPLMITGKRYRVTPAGKTAMQIKIPLRRWRGGLW